MKNLKNIFNSFKIYLDHLKQENLALSEKVFFKDNLFLEAQKLADKKLFFFKANKTVYIASKPYTKLTFDEVEIYINMNVSSLDEYKNVFQNVIHLKFMENIKEVFCNCYQFILKGVCIQSRVKNLFKFYFKTIDT